MGVHAHKCPVLLHQSKHDGVYNITYITYKYLPFFLLMFRIYISIFYRALEAALTSAAVLITYGVVLGKLNPFQVLVMTLIESPLFVANAYLGYKVLGAIDVGG